MWLYECIIMSLVTRDYGQHALHSYHACGRRRGSFNRGHDYNVDEDLVTIF